jgi:hypothetical protein
VQVQLETLNKDGKHPSVLMAIQRLLVAIQMIIAKVLPGYLPVIVAHGHNRAIS